MPEEVACWKCGKKGIFLLLYVICIAWCTWHVTCRALREQVPEWRFAELGERVLTRPGRGPWCSRRAGQEVVR